MSDVEHKEYRGKVCGEVVFGVSGPANYSAPEALRYAHTYARDGDEVLLETKKGRRWVKEASIVWNEP